MGLAKIQGALRGCTSTLFCATGSSANRRLSAINSGLTLPRLKNWRVSLDRRLSSSRPPSAASGATRCAESFRWRLAHSDLSSRACSRAMPRLRRRGGRKPISRMRQAS